MTRSSTPRRRHPRISLGVLTCLALAATITPIVGAPPVAQGILCPKVALFVASTSPAPRGDGSFLSAVEEALPGCVSTVSDESITAAEAEAADLVIISSSVVPTVLRDRLVDVGTPVLVAEPYLFDDMSLAERNGRELTERTTLQITDVSHPLAGGLSGVVAVYRSPAKMNYGLDDAAPGIEPVANSGGTSKQLTIFGFEAGSQLTDRPAAGARVAFFPSYGATLTGDARTLVHAAMGWLVDQESVGPTDGDAVAEDVDNCPYRAGSALDFNALQFDTDQDAIGDTCDPSPTARSTANFSFGLGHGNLSSSAVALADLDGDDDLDALVTNQDVGEPSRVWSNDGTGQFSDSGQPIGSGGALWVELGDVDNDGDVDAVVSNTSGAQVWVNDGTGTFTDSGQRLGDESMAFLGDVDADGDLDIFAADGIPADGVDNRIWFNDGTGTFTDSGQRLGTASMGWVGFGDLDVDGDLDAFVSGNGDSRVWTNDGNGLFTDSGQRLSVGNVWALGLDLGDIDGDGDLDAFVTTHVRNAAEAGIPDQVWINDGTGVFADSGQRLDGDADVDVALGDLDGDGDLDAFTASNSGALNDHVWINDGTGAFSDSGQVSFSTRSQGVALGDLDGDRDLDAFVANWWGDDTVWFNNNLPVESAALLVAGSTRPPGGDRDIADIIRGAGLDLTIVDDDSDLASIDPNRYAAIFISTSVVPTKVGNVFRDAPVPVIIWEGYLFDDMEMSASGETPTVSTDITIVDSAHRLAAGLPAGNVRVYSDAQKLSYGAPAPTADVVAIAPSQPNRAVIFSYGTGDLLVDGSPSPGPRVALFPNYLGAQQLTTDGAALIGSAIDWALDGPGVERPPNDDFENRFTATVGSQYGSNIGATTQPGEWALGGESVWWQWTATSDGFVRFDTIGSTFDTVLGVWDGEELATLTLLKSNDDSGGGLQSALTLGVTAGASYQIAVYSYWFEGESSPGDVQLNIGSVGLPANDDFADRIDFVGASVTGAYVPATLEPDEPLPSVGRTPDGSVWWEWTAPVDGLVEIEDWQSNSIMAVWSGDSLDTLIEVDSNDGQSAGPYEEVTIVSFTAEAGRVYQIAVYGDSDSSGEVTLRLTTSQGPPRRPSRPVGLDHFGVVRPRWGDRGAGCEDRTRHLMITNRSRTVRLVPTCAVSCALIRHDAFSRADWCCLVSANTDSFVGNPWARSRSCGTRNRRRSTAPEYPSVPAGRGSPRHHHGARRRPHCWCETWDRDPSPGGDG